MAQKQFETNYDIWFSEHHMEHDVKLSMKVEVLHMEQTPFQLLHMMHNDSLGNFMTLDGFIQVTEKDEFIYHDMICHVPMAVNPGARRVLIIGGGDGGTAREVCRYKHIEKVDMIEIDEAVVKACKKYLPGLSGTLFSDPRIDLRFEDGLAFVKRAADSAYDLILVDSTDPEGPGEGLFTTEFYKDCFRILSENGILINQHECPFYGCDAEYMTKAHAKIKKVFPIAKVYGFNVPTYSSGYWYFGFASKKLDPIVDQQAEIWEKFGLKTKYYNADIHRGSFALPTYVKEILESV